MPARMATLEELVGHPLDARIEYRISLPSEVHRALKEGYILMESFQGPNEEPFVLLGLPDSEEQN